MLQEWFLKTATSEDPFSIKIVVNGHYEKTECRFTSDQTESLFLLRLSYEMALLGRVNKVQKCFFLFLRGGHVNKVPNYDLVTL